MRHSNLAVAVLLGVGALTTNVAALPPQAGTPASLAPTKDAQMLSRRVRAEIAAALLLEKKQNAVPKFEFQGDVDHLRPMDCAMPVIKGDPAVDPQFSKPPQLPDNVRHTITVIPVQPCPGSNR